MELHYLSLIGIGLITISFQAEYTDCYCTINDIATSIGCVSAPSNGGTPRRRQVRCPRPSAAHVPCCPRLTTSPTPGTDIRAPLFHGVPELQTINYYSLLVPPCNCPVSSEYSSAFWQSIQQYHFFFCQTGHSTVTSSKAHTTHLNWVPR